MPMLTVDQVDARILKGGSCRSHEHVAPGYSVGDKIVALNIHPATHTRLPRYIRGKKGTVMFDHGVFVFPDTTAERQGEQPQHCYSVCFTFQELWGPEASATDSLYIDLFESYVRPDVEA
ncbi:SH3-like domain-containing protein [Pseudomonas mohnii]